MEPGHVVEDIPTVPVTKKGPGRISESIQPTKPEKTTRCFNLGKLEHMCRNCQSKQQDNWIARETRKLNKDGQDLRVTSYTRSSIEAKHQDDTYSRDEMVLMDSVETEQAVNNLSRFETVERI